jgi:hypothetical protein
MKGSVRVLLQSLIDYAGLFPPAGLPMEQAVANYASYLAGEHRWALGRFIVPASRLGELEAAVARQASPSEPWELSLLASGSTEEDLAAASEFNERHQGELSISSFETKASSLAAIEELARSLGPSMVPYVELPLSVETPQLIRALAARNLRAKIRTGGVTADAFPSPVQVASFIAACAQSGVPFKATAGLHHPLRCTRPLTYERDSPTGAMHGFVNLFLAAALLRAGVDPDVAARLLEDADPASFTLEEARIGWRDYAVTGEDLASTRAELAISFGSCSFEEPITDLKDLNWLP